MQDVKITYNEIAAYMTIINIVLGILLGSFPLIAGLKMKNRNYAIYGFIGSIIGGAILGAFLAYPIAVIFTWLILRSPKETVEAINRNSDETENLAADNL